MSGITSNGGPSTSSGRTAFFYGPFDKLSACPDLIRRTQKIPSSAWKIPFVVSLSNHERNHLERRLFASHQANAESRINPKDYASPGSVAAAAGQITALRAASSLGGL